MKPLSLDCKWCHERPGYHSMVRNTYLGNEALLLLRLHLTGPKLFILIRGFPFDESWSEFQSSEFQSFPSKVAHWHSGHFSVAYWMFFAVGLHFLLQDYFWALLNVNKNVAHWTFFSGILDVFYFNVIKVYLFVHKTEIFDMNIIIFIIFYIFLNKTTWYLWVWVMTETQTMTEFDDSNSDHDSTKIHTLLVQVWRKNVRIIGWRPLRLENPGSATASCYFILSAKIE